MDRNTSNINASGSTTTARLAEILKAKNIKNNSPKGPKTSAKSQYAPKSFIRRSGPRGG
jgi:hypothetical protein